MAGVHAAVAVRRFNVGTLVTLGDALARELPFLRSQAESRMGAANGASTARIRRKGAGTQDEATGLVARVWTDIAASQPARLGPFGGGKSRGVRGLTPGGVTWEQADRILHLPASTPRLQDGDIAEITAGENVGTFWQVIESTWHDQATAYRVPVAQINRPEGW